MPTANPTTVRYPPEELLFGRVIASILDTKTLNLQDIIRIEPRVVCATNIGVERTASVYTHATIDTLTDVINLNNGAMPQIAYDTPLQLWAKKAYRLWFENKTGGPITNKKARDKYLVDDLTTVMKLRLGLTLNGEDERLATKFSLRENLAAGRLPYRFPRLEDLEVKRVVWESRVMTAGLNSDETIGSSITIPAGEKVILTGVGSDAPDAVTDEVYIKVDRDKDQSDYLEINVAALPNDLNYFVPLWVPAVEEMKVRLTCTVAQVGGHPCRYQYVRAPLTLADKVKWGLDLSTDERLIAEALDLFDRIAAGIYPLSG